MEAGVGQVTYENPFVSLQGSAADSPTALGLGFTVESYDVGLSVVSSPKKCTQRLLDSR